MNKAASKYFVEQAKFIRRDLRNGDYQEHEIPEIIAVIWRDDEDELRRAYEIESLAELKAGILAQLPAKRKVKKARKKTSKKAKKTKSKKRSWWFW